MNENLKKQLLDEYYRVLSDYKDIDIGYEAYSIDKIFAYRILLGRMPNLDHEIKHLLHTEDTWREFINNLLNSDEFSKRLDFLPKNKQLMSKENEFKFWFNSSDREMGAKMGMGDYEPETTSLIEKLLKPGMHCLDIGAQTGFYTCKLANLVGKQGKVYAFEPMKESHALAQMNIEENNFQDIVNLYNTACSNTNDDINVDIKSGMVVASNDGKFQIKSVKVDDLNIKNIDFCKIDIEGHEPQAIIGMQNLIKKYTPIILTELNEYWLKQAGSSTKEYLTLLKNFNYNIFDIDNNFSELKSFKVKHELYNLNVIAIHKSKCKVILNELLESNM